MTTPSKPKTLLPLFSKLKACPSQDDRCSVKVLLETWKSFRQLDPEQGYEVTPAMLAGLILHDPDTFAPLLNEGERWQLIALGKVALERYQEKTNPPNQLGKTIAATLKEPT